MLWRLLNYLKEENKSSSPWKIQSQYSPTKNTFYTFLDAKTTKKINDLRESYEIISIMQERHAEELHIDGNQHGRDIIGLLVCGH